MSTFKCPELRFFVLEAARKDKTIAENGSERETQSKI